MNRSKFITYNQLLKHFQGDAQYVFLWLQTKRLCSTFDEVQKDIEEYTKYEMPSTSETPLPFVTASSESPISKVIEKLRKHKPRFKVIRCERCLDTIKNKEHFINLGLCSSCNDYIKRRYGDRLLIHLQVKGS